MTESAGTESAGGERTWGPYPGDALAPPPTPQAPEIPMSSGWLYAAGAAVALKFAAIGLVALIALVVVIGLLVHWF
jgi:hypothetical protein